MTRSWFNPNLDALWSTVPSLVAILVALEGLMVTGLSVARERELGTFDQLLVSPLSPGEIVLGKTVPAFLIGMAEGTLMIAVAVFVFRIPLTGSVPLLVCEHGRVSCWPSSASGSSFRRWPHAAAGDPRHVLVHGADDAAYRDSPARSRTCRTGCSMLTLANPIRHFMVIVKGVFLKAMPAGDVLRTMGPLFPIAAVTLTAATWLFRRRTG